MDKDQKNSAIDCTFITGEESPRNDMLTELLANILSEPLFDILRTKKQLGVCFSPYFIFLFYLFYLFH